jgi:hypothetical protein
MCPYNNISTNIILANVTTAISAIFLERESLFEKKLSLSDDGCHGYPAQLNAAETSFFNRSYYIHTCHHHHHQLQELEHTWQLVSADS